ncbi:MAG: hypothetical protein IBX46_09120 [Desulfuromonadales bacterium]|nr:hypothetical protein [Desulfuromonadales bacterium]
MILHPLTTFSQANRRQILLLIVGHLLWSAVIFLLSVSSQRLAVAGPGWSGIFIALQLYAAAQLLLPALLLHPESRRRSFYLFWGLSLALLIWLLNQLPASGIGQELLTALRSGALLLIATVTAGALARYVHRLWEIIPVGIVMTLADFASWRYGPTATFTEQIEHYRLSPEGAPPLVDMILIKLAFPGSIGLAPLFGISDWIMVVFFAIVADRFGVNDNLIGASGESLARQGKIGRYLPISVLALYIATLLAQLTGHFIPALPLIALIMLLWYTARFLLQRQQGKKILPSSPDKDENRP